MRPIASFALVATLITACGGGSSDSGVGSDKAASSKPGTFSGSGMVEVTGPGGTESFKFDAVLTITNSGQVQFDILGGTGDCALADDVVLKGNGFNYGVTANCALGDLGVCAISESANGLVKNGKARIDLDGHVACGRGTASYAGSWSGTENKAIALSAYGRAEQDARLIDSLKGALGV